MLQDLSEVIEEAKSAGLPSQIQLMAHNFFEPQPQEMHGARAYYVSFILRNWPDKEAIQILSHLKAAMKPGYSKVLIFEAVVAERVADVRPVTAAMDITMMSHYAALERTKAQWEILLKKAGLKYVDYHQAFPPDSGSI